MFHEHVLSGQQHPKQKKDTESQGQLARAGQGNI
jgi:hypothetical protein